MTAFANSAFSSRNGIEPSLLTPLHLNDPGVVDGNHHLPIGYLGNAAHNLAKDMRLYVRTPPTHENMYQTR